MNLSVKNRDGGPSTAGQRLWPTAMILAGVLLLLYVGTQYATMYHEQRRLAQEWQRQNRALQDSPRDVPIGGDGLTRMTIPRIHLDAIVVEGTSRQQLLVGPGHVRSTPAPGEAGNAVITAHRDTFFRHIYELNQGDVILLQRGGRVFKYEVTAKKVVEPEDVSVLHPTTKARLTLITCYPTYYIGPAPERLVVFSRLVDDDKQAISDKQSATSSSVPHR